MELEQLESHMERKRGKGREGGKEGWKEQRKEGREIQSFPYYFLKPYTKIPIFSNNIHVVSSKPYIKLLNLYKKT